MTLYKDYDEMMKHEGLEAVVIATVTTVHAEQAIKAINIDKHVLCEKVLKYQRRGRKYGFLLCLYPCLTRSSTVLICRRRRWEETLFQNPLWLLLALRRLLPGRVGACQRGRRRLPGHLPLADVRQAGPEWHLHCVRRVLQRHLRGSQYHEIDMALWFLRQDSMVKSVSAVGVVEFHGGKIMYF